MHAGADVEVRPKWPACHVPRHERRGRQADALGRALEHVLVVERGGRERVVADKRHAGHLEHRRGVGGRIVALNAACIEPSHVNVFATQPLAEMHVVRHELDVAKADTPQRGGNVGGHGLIAAPRSRVVRRIDHAAGRRPVAAEYHGQTQPRQQPFDLSFELGHALGLRAVHGDRDRNLVLIDPMICANFAAFFLLIGPFAKARWTCVTSGWGIELRKQTKAK
jgi:hypothetical protein